MNFIKNEFKVTRGACLASCIFMDYRCLTETKKIPRTTGHPSIQPLAALILNEWVSRRLAEISPGRNPPAMLSLGLQ